MTSTAGAVPVTGSAYVFSMHDNLVHGSDSPEPARREIALSFGG